MSALKTRDQLLTFFPLPRLLSMDAAGLEISEHSLKYLRFGGRDRMRIEAFGNADLPPDVIAHGEIQNVEALSEALRALRSKIGTPWVHVSLPEQKGYIFRMQVPRDAHLGVREAIEFRLEDHVPLPPSEVIFDWEPIISESTETELSLNVTAFPRATIEEYYEAVSASGLTPLSFEIESQAAARAVLPTNGTTTSMIVDFGETRTAIAVAQGGVVRFTTSLELAGSALTHALIEKLKVTPQEVERLKNEEGIQEGRSEAGKLMQGAALALRNEIQRHFVYWHTHRESSGLSHQPIQSIILCGGNANLRGLPAYLAQTMRAEVVLANVWQNALLLPDYVPPVAQSQSLRYATVVGLALRRGLRNA